MVKIIGFKESQKQNGEVFYKLQVQGGVELVQSKTTGKFYMTARTCYIPTTFDEATCKGLIGTELMGTVEKVEVPAYDYAVPDTGEVISLTHSWEYTPIEPAASVLQNKPTEEMQAEALKW